MNTNILLWDIEQFGLSVSLKMWTSKISLVSRTSSKTQTSSTFRLLSFTNAVHPPVSSNFCLPAAILIRYLAGQTFLFNTRRWTLPCFLSESNFKCFSTNFFGKFCQANVNEYHRVKWYLMKSTVFQYIISDLKFYKPNISLQLTRGPWLSMYDGFMTRRKDGLHVLKELALSRVVTSLAVMPCFPAKLEHYKPDVLSSSLVLLKIEPTKCVFGRTC